MARIIESENQSRRIIKLSTEDVLSIVADYQRIVPRGAEYCEVRDYLEDSAIFIPEEY